MKMKLTELRERVAKAVGADRAIDVAVARAFAAKQPTRMAPMDEEGSAMGVIDANNEWVEIPYVTQSVDAALGLVERLLPGWVFSICGPDSMDSRSLANLWPDAQPFPAELDINEPGQTLPLAILAALLSAMAALHPEMGETK